MSSETCRRAEKVEEMLERKEVVALSSCFLVGLVRGGRCFIGKLNISSLVLTGASLESFS